MTKASVSLFTIHALFFYFVIAQQIDATFTVHRCRIKAGHSARHPHRSVLDRHKNQAVALIIKNAKTNVDQEKDETNLIDTQGQSRLFSSQRASLTAAPPVGTGTTWSDFIDTVLSALTSDIGSIILGILGILALLIGRLVLDNDTDTLNASLTASATRFNLLAILATGALLLNGFSKLNVDSALATPVTYANAMTLSQPVVLKENFIKNASAIVTIEWALQSLLVATTAKTAVLLSIAPSTSLKSKSVWRIVAMAGIIPASEFLDNNESDRKENTVVPPVSSHTPILNRFLMETQRETYLPNLQALPGKVEFTYLPTDTQGALMLPVATGHNNNDSNNHESMVLVLGLNQARSFTPRDILWCQAIATRIGDCLCNMD